VVITRGSHEGLLQGVTRVVNTRVFTRVIITRGSHGSITSGSRGWLLQMVTQVAITRGHAGGYYKWVTRVAITKLAIVLYDNDTSTSHTPSGRIICMCVTL
jgi:hypothetical protein